MKRVETLAELKAVFKDVKSAVAGDTRFSATAVLFIAERLVNIEAALTRPQVYVRKARKPSEWQRFFARGMKAGKSPAQIGAEWRARKRA